MGEADPFEDDPFEVGVEVFDRSEILIDNFCFPGLINQYAPQPHFKSGALHCARERIRRSGIGIELKE